MLYGIDISNWQEGLSLPTSLDFAIMKATGGTGFVDLCCDAWVQECKRKGILWGFYHFAGDGWTPKPEEEANWFYENCVNYFGEGLPVLDIEDSRIADFGTYAQRFVDRIHSLTGIYPIIYTSSAHRRDFAHTQVPKTCGLWEAYYPSNNVRLFDSNAPEYSGPCDPWDFVAMWQYSSNGRVSGYDFAVDLDVAFMDADAWHRYANPDWTPIPVEQTQELPTQSNLHTFEDDSVKVTVELK